MTFWYDIMNPARGARSTYEASYEVYIATNPLYSRVLRNIYSNGLQSTARVLINELNLNLQGANWLIPDAYSSIKAFKLKLTLYSHIN